MLLGIDRQTDWFIIETIKEKTEESFSIKSYRTGKGNSCYDAKSWCKKIILHIKR